MSFQSNIFDSKCINLENNNHLHFINIPILNDTITAYIDSKIVSICEGETETSLDIIKQRLIDDLTTKKGSNLEMGTIAEFFGHLYLTEIGFKQEFLFLNLEERSIKKGFDGYYSHNNETWIYESKSGSIESKGASHKEKISSAYYDLKGKISGNPKNNPWHNAYNHACHIDVATAANIRSNIKKLSDEFTKGKRYDIGHFNIIPGSTLFLEGVWSDIDINNLIPNLKSLIKKFSFKNIHMICVNKDSTTHFWNYLER